MSFLPVPNPSVMYKKMMLVANTLIARQKPASTAPAIVTGRHPYLFTRELDIGPESDHMLKKSDK